MKEKIFLFYVLFYCNMLHLAENFCDEQVNRSEIQQQICNHYHCEYGYPILEKIITCSYISTSSLIPYVGRSTTSDGYLEYAIYAYPITLKIMDSEGPYVPSSFFKNFRNLTILYWENSNIQKIMPGAFNFLDNLKELYLEGNQLTTISDGLFNSLTLLEKLDISRNRVQNVSDHAFEGLKLDELSLRNNNISQIGEVLLNSVTTLTTLDLSWNNLNETDSFNNVQLLHALNLSHNILNVVDFALFPETLYTIDLSFNKIGELLNINESGASEIILNHNSITTFDNLNVIHLDVSYNELETVGSDLFGGNLKRFYAGNNFISTVNADAFLHLYDLEYLLLNDNNLSSIPNSCFKDLRSLTHLDLSGNKLTSFTYGTFDNLINLKVLNISNNNFKDLPQYAFHSLGKLTDLFFQNNEISEIQVNKLALHMPSLQIVSLDNNVWSCKRLVDIVHGLKNMNVSFSNGNYWEESNIHGIKCYDTLDETVVDESSKSVIDPNSKFTNFFNEGFTKTLMYKYFNKEFKGSNFFKYLESLNNNASSTMQNLNSTYFEKSIIELISNFSNLQNKEFTQSAMYNYFNKDFESSNFFKYLETFKNKDTNENNSEKLMVIKLDELIRAIKEMVDNKSFLNNSNNSLNQDFSKSDIYKYFTEDFKNSNFFKYLKGLSDRTISHKSSDNFNESIMEKLVSSPEAGKSVEYIPNYTGLLSFISMLLFIITCVMMANAYLSVLHGKKYGRSKKEEVELI